MPRSVRHEYAGAIYHAMCRGNHGQAIYKTDKGLRLFLSTLGEVCLQTGWRIHAYVLMSNHYLCGAPDYVKLGTLPSRFCFYFLPFYTIHS